MFARQERYGTLTVDGIEVASAESPGGATELNVDPPFYFGGVADDRENTRDKIPVLLVKYRTHQSPPS